MLISVIIPTFNRCGKVLRALDSVLNQSFKDFEVIVVDDGSTDRTGFWIEKVGDARVKYVKVTPLPEATDSKSGPGSTQGSTPTNYKLNFRRGRPLCLPAILQTVSLKVSSTEATGSRGVATARNFGVSKSSADWICFLDSDDVWHRHKLSEQVRFHASHPEILISHTDDVWIRDSVRVNKMKKQTICEDSLFKDSLERCMICCSTVMIQKELFLQTGGFDEALETCEDYDLWLRILAQHPVGFVHQKLVTKFGGHEDQLSKKFPMMDKYRIYALEKLLSSGDLNPDQASLVREQINIKSAIINKGRSKRENKTPCQSQVR